MSWKIRLVCGLYVLLYVGTIIEKDEDSVEEVEAGSTMSMSQNVPMLVCLYIRHVDRIPIPI